MAEIGWATLGIIPSFKGFESKLDQGTSKHMLAAGRTGGDKFGAIAGKHAGSKFGSVFKTAAKAGLVGLAGAGALGIKIGKDSVEQASDLNESLNAVRVSYGQNAKAVKLLGRQSATALGLSNSAFNSLAVQFSAFSKTIAGSAGGPKVVKVLDDLTTRASDFASVMNLDVADATGIFQSGLAGEAEPLRKFGIDLSAAKVEAFALSSGIVKNTDDLDEAAKVQARYGLLMKQTKQTQGDFAKTSDSLANKQRILNARWDDAQAKFGKALLPMLEEGADFMLKKGVPAFEGFSTWVVKDGIPAMQDLSAEIRPVVGHAKDLAGWLNDLPNPAKLAGLTALFGGVAAMKLRGGNLGSGGALGTAGKALGLAKPVPVFVTNMGAGLAAGKAGKIAGSAGPVGFALAAMGASVASGVSPAITPSNANFAKTAYLLTQVVDKLTGSNGVEKGILRANDAASKLPNQLEQGKTAAQNLYGEIFKIGKADPKVKISAPGFAELFDKTARYGSMLDGLDGRTVTTFVRSVARNNDTGEGGGTNPQPPGRSGVTVNIGTVQAQDYRDFTKQMTKRARHTNGGGVYFP